MTVDSAVFQAWNFFIAIFYAAAIILVWVVLEFKSLTAVIITIALSTFILFMWSETLLAFVASVI